MAVSHGFSDGANQMEGFYAFIGRYTETFVLSQQTVFVMFGSSNVSAIDFLKQGVTGPLA